MGKSAKWLKNVLLGKKPSKSSGSKAKEAFVSQKEILVTAKVEESDVISDLPSFATNTVEPDEVSDDETQFPERKPTEFQNVALVQDNSLSDAERIRQEIAAMSLQAVFRGYLARRAFLTLKGIIRLQAFIRGHLVRRTAVATLCCVMGIVRLQALARGGEIRNSDIGVHVHRNCRLQLLQNKLGNSADLGIKKLTANAFAQKLLASSPRVIPVYVNYDASNPNSNSIWLKNWSDSCFWKCQNKFVNTAQIIVEAKPKKSVRKLPAASFESSSVQTSFEFEKHKRSFRKVSRQLIEPLAVENPQTELEKVKLSLRKVHNPVVESSIIVMEVEKPKLDVEKTTVEESVSVSDIKTKKELSEQPEEVVIPVGKVLVEEEIQEKDTEEEKTPKPNKKEKQKSKKKSSVTNKIELEESNDHQTTSRTIPSYMQATKSAKAKLRLQSSPKSAEQETEKANVTRRNSLPFSGNGRISSNSPRTMKITNSGDKTGNKKEKPLLLAAKTTPVNRKR